MPGAGERRYSTPASEPDNGWSLREVFTLANSISIARLLSAPLLGWWILQEEWSWCLGGLVIAGISDWADGFVAKRYNQTSVLGTYLDPLADKVLIAAVVGALGAQGTLPPHVVAVLISRDVLLVAGGFYHRASTLGWRPTTAAEFFRVAPAAGRSAAPAVRPTPLSKANTVLQFGLVGSCLSSELCGWPPAAVADTLLAATLLTTVLSGLQYLHMYRTGALFARR